MQIKYLIKLLYISLILFILIGIYQSINYDPKYINRATFQIDFNKIRTPFIKRVFLKSEFLIHNIFVQNVNYEKNNQNELPKYKYINYSSNKLVGFIKTNYTFHSVPEIKCDEEVPRKTLLINLNFKQ